MSLSYKAVIELPDAAGSLFDHGAFDPKTRRVFVAHTARDRVEVIDHDTSRHLATLNGVPEPAGVVADDGHVLVTNRGAAGLAWIDAHTLATRAVLDTGPRPNGVAIVSRSRLAAVACIGDEIRGPELQAIDLSGHQRWIIDLPGRPRWCVPDAAGKRLFLAIRDPSMVLVARLPELDDVQHWALPSHGAHGIDIDYRSGLLYVACDGGALVELDAVAGEVRGEWPLVGVPDATFFNPSSGIVHVAIGEPGLVQSIDPHTGVSVQFSTAPGAQTTALVPPDHLYVFSPQHQGIVDLVEAARDLALGVSKHPLDQP
jgi:DNA-binding beta-propeller fold protein YncE